MKCDLILGLDVADETQAMEMLQRVGPSVDIVKIGLQLFTRHGPGLVERVASRGHRIFLDLKLHDIPNTVASAVRSLAHLPIDLLTIHTCGGLEMMRAAAQAQRESRPQLTLLGVTVLTSLGKSALNETGIPGEPGDQVLRMARLARTAGLGGLISSPIELPALRAELGDSMKLITPGVRPAGSDVGDQQRVMTPAEAARAGASGIVVGRPIVKATDPAAAARAIRAELDAA